MQYSCENGSTLKILLSAEESRLMLLTSPDIGKLLRAAAEHRPLCACALSAPTARLMTRMIAQIEQTTALGLLRRPTEPLIVDFAAKQHNGELLIEMIIRRQSDCEQQNERPSDDRAAARRTQNRKTIKLKSRCLIFRFAEFFDAYDCIAAVKSHKIAIDKCRLFLLGKNYYLALGADRRQTKPLTMIMSDFGKKCPARFSACLGERAALIRDNFQHFVQ